MGERSRSYGRANHIDTRAQTCGSELVSAHVSPRSGCKRGVVLGGVADTRGCPPAHLLQSHTTHNTLSVHVPQSFAACSFATHRRAAGVPDFSHVQQHYHSDDQPPPTLMHPAAPSLSHPSAMTEGRGTEGPLDLKVVSSRHFATPAPLCTHDAGVTETGAA
jgi:hypothetical protein